MLSESYSFAEHVHELDAKIDEGETKYLPVRHHYARLSSCLWEAALVKICTCWSQPKSNKYTTIVHGKKPALIIGDTQDLEIKKIVWKLRVVRNDIAHPDVITKRAKNLSIQRTGSSNPPRHIPTTFAIVQERRAPSQEVAEALGRLIGYTIREARSMSAG